MEITTLRHFLVVVLFLLGSSLKAQLNFTSFSSIPSTFPTDIKLVDFNNDGDLDLMRTVYGASNTSSLNDTEIWLNDGAGNFSLFQAFGGKPSFSCVSGDFNNDGFADIFISGFGAGVPAYNWVRLNNGDATFTSTSQQLGFRDTSAITIADFDLDGDLDVVAGNSGNSSYENVLWLNDGSGFFTAGTQLIGSDKTYDIASADVDNDGDVDLICANQGPNLIWKNDGNGFFTTTQAFEDNYSISVSVADIDNDNDIDLIFWYSDENKVYKNDGSGNFSYYASIPPNYPSTFIEFDFADFDADGDLDIVAGIAVPEINNQILINDGLGNFTVGFQFSNPDTREVAVGDIDNDNDIDVFFMNTNNQNSQFWKNTSLLSVNESNYTSPVVTPNPFKEFVSIDLNYAFADTFLKIVDLTGKVVYTKAFVNQRFINITPFIPKGTYILEVVSETKYRSTFKLVKT